MNKQRGVYEKIRGSNEWWIRYADANGRLRREVAGTKSGAIDLYRKRKNQALEGKKLPEKLRKAAVTFADLADETVSYIKNNYARPADDLARMKPLKERLNDRAADTITAGEVRNLLDTLTTVNQWSASTRNHHHNLISLAYRLGIEHGKVKENPARAVGRKSELPSRRVRFLTPEEETKLLNAIRSKSEWAEHEPEMDFALHTGLRRSSMYLDLVWENVDLVGRVAIVPRTKNGEPVHVPLNDNAMRALAIFRSRGDGTGRVVRNLAGETLNVNAHWFVPAVRQAGIKNFRWHDLRHTYASRLRQTGTPLGNIAELLGHRQLAMSQRYAHLSISNLHEAVARIQKPTDTATDTSPSGAFAYVN